MFKKSCLDYFCTFLSNGISYLLVKSQGKSIVGSIWIALNLLNYLMRIDVFTYRILICQVFLTWKSLFSIFVQFFSSLNISGYFFGCLSFISILNGHSFDSTLKLDSCMYIKKVSFGGNSLIRIIDSNSFLGNFLETHLYHVKIITFKSFFLIFIYHISFSKIYFPISLASNNNNNNWLPCISRLWCECLQHFIFVPLSWGSFLLFLVYWEF